MSNRVPTFLLLFCASLAGFLAEAMSTNRYLQEMNDMLRNLSVYDDNGRLVSITVTDEPRTGPWLTDLLLTVTFDLYTRNNPTDGQKLEINSRKKLTSSNFDSERSTRFVTHGWTNSGQSRSCVLIRKAYLTASDDNVIVVDWSSISQLPYPVAANGVELVAQKVAVMIDFLVDEGALKPGNTTLVGHSLGAHVMGLAGFYSKYIISNVVGLDPALPMFSTAGPTESISTMSGNHVQIIHTNAGGAGYLTPVGHSDFYPNGGIVQPGCCKHGSLLRCAACSHGRAVEFFAESISHQFEGVRCDSFLEYQNGYCRVRAHTTPMGGLSLDHTVPGSYYLLTASKYPFSSV